MPGRLRQKSQEFKASLGNIGSMRSVTLQETLTLRGRQGITKGAGIHSGLAGRKRDPSKETNGVFLKGGRGVLRLERFVCCSFFRGDLETTALTLKWTLPTLPKSCQCLTQELVEAKVVAVVISVSALALSRYKGL